MPTVIPDIKQQDEGSHYGQAWWKLTPQHNKGTPTWFAASMSSQIFNHSNIWTSADETVKSAIGTAASLWTPAAVAWELAQGAYSVANSALAFGGMGIHMTTAKVWSNGKAPFQVNCQGSLYAEDDTGSNLDAADNLRMSVQPRMVTGSTGNVGRLGIQAGTLYHPDWFTVELVVGGGAIIKMKDMLPKSMGITVNGPYIGRSPSLVNINVGFEYAYDGFSDVVSINGNYNR